MSLRLLQDLFVALEKKGQRLLDAIMESIRRPYKSTVAITGGQFAKL